MRLARGTVATADHKLFDSCDPVILRSRSCGVVPRVRRLFIGYGTFEPPSEIDEAWATETWAAWLDRRRIRLPAFGTSDRTLFTFGPAGGQDVTLREWHVMLVRATPGRHTIRYRIQSPDFAIDATWTFTVAAR